MNRARVSSVRRIRHGACGAVCSAARRPSASQRRIVWVQTPSWRAASWIETPCPSVRWRGAAEMAARSRMPATRDAVNGSPVGVRRPCFARIIAISESGECWASLRMSSMRSSLVLVRFKPLWLSLTRSSLRAPPCHSSSATPLCRSRSMLITTSLSSARRSCFRSRSVVVGAAHTRGRSPARRRSALRSSSSSGAARRSCSASSARAFALNEREGLFERALKGTGDEAVLGLARVVLALAAGGFELGALERDALQTNALLVVVEEVLDRARRRVHAGRSDGLKKRIGDGAVKAQPADRLAGPPGAVHLVRTRAQVAGRAPVGSGVGDHHPPPALATTQQPLQQRGALACSPATLAAGTCVCA